ncbi:SDR family NAD(P)-dependent oxidoreductase [Nocardia amamiensis]|uniref:SDR family NAD(P)-dependent oxidoreductase n=1 Tax=Nocardia amamiensis TaxID=404578 RepID=A0ABS0D2T5_9NOCA|nr:SDR family NAD(P)-dependent oxidoreductase [Nocardia amamiensis]MBF6301408.1 SDR family NAD(P)-dependent oxidoreductase [Nocardia amamiensis]
MTVVLVTGAANGMGAATMEHLVALGYTVEGCDRLAAPGVARVDVRDAEAVDRWVRDAHTRHGRVDAVVTFAAYGVVGAVEETTPEEAAALFDTNVLGTHRVLRAVLPLLRDQGAGRVIVVSSGAGAIAEPYGGWYSATKAAVERIGEAARMEAAEFGVRVSVLIPGWTVTPIIDTAEHVAAPIAAYDRDRAAVLDLVRGYLAAGQPAASVARKVAAILAADRPRQAYLCGRDVRLSFWTRRLVPAFVYERLVQRYYGFR